MYSLRLKKWKFWVTRFTLCISVIMSLPSFRISINNLKETEKCPICFGLAACHFIDDNEITINHRDMYALFTNAFGVKNVYYGKLRNRDVVLKKLAHRSEFNAFDESISKVVKEKYSDFQMLVQRAINTDMNDTMSKLRLCPTVKHVNLLFNNVLSKEDFTYEHLWTLIKINPEPLILQILPSEKGWPVPKHYGACGRLVIQEFVGPSLSTFSGEPWIRRAAIASTLLDAAYMFTFQDENFAYYLTDISSDNIAIDSKNRAKFIDLENIIVVDKTTPVKDQSKTWQDVHRSDGNFDCETCLVFSPAEICEHKVSDHNYYAICKVAHPSSKNQ
ncbi:divergent protein kinase domain 2A isoform X2 [Belonocnema kinseyi]|uniref:divergent protein kinase domain 2A isoform X2 n=1 Tax=Belonocnema kinseyi TaxID=2817044 RepID=UPI00143D5E16|nr:divergent protein kinase domain 2A isoform X2 [Belonocnema kinseyi]